MLAAQKFVLFGCFHGATFQTNHPMLLSCHCDVTTPKAKWDGPKAKCMSPSQAVAVICYVKSY